MFKTISATKARQMLGQLMNEVSIRQEHYIIERNGKPIAALVPIAFIEKRELNKKRFMEICETAHKNADNVTEEEITSDIEEAIAEARKK